MGKIEVIEKEIGNVVEIEEMIPMWKMPSVMGKDFNLIMEYLEAEAVKDMGNLYARYLDIDWEAQMAKGAIVNFIEIFTKKWHFQVGIPISKKLNDSANLKSRVLQNRKYIQTIHRGAYQRVGDTYKKMYAYAQEKGLALDKESIEFYLNDPRTTDDAQLETIVLIPLLENKND